MARQIQLRRGTTTQTDAFTGALAEVTVDTDKDTVVVHDGSTAGGHPLAKTSSLGTAAFTAATAYATAAQGTTADAALPKAGGAMTGPITTNSTFDGRAVATDGAKLDNITVTQAVDLDQMEIDIAALANGMVYKGDWDASASTFPGSGSAQIGWFYYVSVAGTVGGVSFSVGDNIVAIADNASTSTYASNWSKHDQTDAVTAVVGLNGSISKSGLLSALNVEDGADVTDAANVTTAGALMDSEVTNLAQVKAFDTTDYATSAQGSTADAALPKSGGAMTGAITTNSTFDGRDVATDGAKLDGIAAGATNVTNNNQLTNGAGYTTNVGDITGVTAGSGISGGGTSGTVTLSHSDTSSQGSVDNSGATVIQDVTLDTYGHVTALGSHTLTLANLGVTASSTELNYVGGVTSAIQPQLNAAATTGKAIAMAIVFG